jgi:hypothetical protein
MGIRGPLIALALLAAGCADLDVAMPGRLRPGLLEAAASASDEPAILALDRLGNLTLNGQTLDLPTAAERRRFGVSVIDLGPLPPAWRPTHAPEGGVMVGLLAKASPLAVAGLRPLDLVRAINGAPVTSPDDVVAALDVPQGEQVRVEVTRPDGATATFEVSAGKPVDDVERFFTPFLFERGTSATGDAFSFGPFDAVFWWCDRLEHAYAGGAGDPSAYLRRFTWGCLGNLVRYERVRDVLTGEERSVVRIFFIPFGDDL